MSRTNDYAFRVAVGYAKSVSARRFPNLKSSRPTRIRIPPTGKAGVTTGITISRFAGDRICQDHAIWDLFGLVRQFGVIPG